MTAEQIILNAEENLPPEFLIEALYSAATGAMIGWTEQDFDAEMGVWIDDTADKIVKTALGSIDTDGEEMVDVGDLIKMVAAAAVRCCRAKLPFEPIEEAGHD